jgi:hypothetical protein
MPKKSGKKRQSTISAVPADGSGEAITVPELLAECVELVGQVSKSSDTYHYRLESKQILLGEFKSTCEKLYVLDHHAKLLITIY